MKDRESGELILGWKGLEVIQETETRYACCALITITGSLRWHKIPRCSDETKNQVLSRSDVDECKVDRQ